MKKLFKLLFASLLTVSLLVACGGTGDNGDTDTPDGEESDLEIVVVLDSGGVDDKSFNQSTWEGVKRYLKDNNLDSDTATYLTSAGEDQYVPNLDNAASSGADLVIAVGFLFGDAMEEVAPKYPDVEFLFIDGFSELPNVHSTSFAEHEGSYLVGVIAGQRAKADGTNRVGFVGGIEIPVIYRFQAGFEQGVWEANPEAIIDVQYANSFDDASLGVSLATKMYDAGTNIIFHAAGNVGNGVISEAKEREDVYVIGVDSDQYDDGKDETGESVILTSMLKRVDMAAYNFIAEYVDNDGVVSTDLYEFNLNNGLIQAETSADRNLTAEEIATIEEYTEKFKAGEFTIPEEPIIPNQKAWNLADAEANAE